MPIVITQDGRRWAVGNLTRIAQGYALKLFVNDVVPTPLFTASSFVEASFDGYSPLLLPAGSGAFIDLNGNATVTWPGMVFTVGPAGGSDTVYGYFVVGIGGILLWAERSPGSGTRMEFPGDVFPLVPSFSAGALA